LLRFAPCLATISTLLRLRKSSEINGFINESPTRDTSVRWLLPEHIEDILPGEAARIEALRRRILDLFGKLEWDPRFDYKKERERR